MLDSLHLLDQSLNIRELRIVRVEAVFNDLLPEPPVFAFLGAKRVALEEPCESETIGARLRCINDRLRSGVVAIADRSESESFA